MTPTAPPLDPARVRAILFDLDGTLADTDDEIVAETAARLKPLQWMFPNRDPVPFLRRALMKSEGIGNFVIGLPDRLGLDAPLARLARRMRGNRPEPPPHDLPLIEGVTGMLATLSERYPLALVTTKGARGTEHFVQQYNFQPHFKVIVSSLTAERLKPHPAPVLYAANALEIPPEACLMVGDTTMDVISGKRAGAQTVGVLCGFGERDELARAGANLILQRTPELVEWMANPN